MKFKEISQKKSAKLCEMVRKTAHTELGAVQKLESVQKRANLVELEKCCKISLS